MVGVNGKQTSDAIGIAAVERRVEQGQPHRRSGGERKINGPFLYFG